MEISIKSKKKLKEILEMKSTMSTMKNSLEVFKGIFEQQKKESVHMNIGQWKLLRLRNWKKKD